MAHKLSSPTSRIDDIESPGFIISTQVGGAKGILLRGRTHGMKTNKRMARSVATSHERTEEKKIVLELYRLRSRRPCV